MKMEGVRSANSHMYSSDPATLELMSTRQMLAGLLALLRLICCVGQCFSSLGLNSSIHKMSEWDQRTSRRPHSSDTPWAGILEILAQCLLCEVVCLLIFLLLQSLEVL